MNRKLALALSASGVVLIVAGLVVMLAVVPSMKKLPADTDVMRTYTGTMPTVLNPQTLAFQKDLPLEVTRHVAVETCEDGLAKLREERLMGSGGKTIEQFVCTYGVDRTTMAAVPDGKVPADWKSSEGYWPREGVVFSWPIGAEKKDYTGWSDDYRSTVKMTFEDEVVHERSGLKTYHYVSSSEAKPIVAEQVQAMGLPVELPKSVLGQLLSSADFGALSGLVKDKLPALLAAWPKEAVPLEYYYAYEGEYWIEPDTGIIIDTKKHELRTVGLGEEMIAGTPLAMLPESQRAMLRMAVSDFTYEQSEASVKDAADQAADTRGRLTLYGTTLPIILIVLGLLDVTAGGLVAMRSRA